MTLPTVDTGGTRQQSAVSVLLRYMLRAPQISFPTEAKISASFSRTQSVFRARTEFPEAIFKDIAFPTNHSRLVGVERVSTFSSCFCQLSDVAAESLISCALGHQPPILHAAQVSAQRPYDTSH